MILSWVENRVFSSRTYLLEEPGEAAWLVDCGCWERLLAQTGREVALQGVLLTHAHYDHIYGLPSLLVRWPECRIYTNTAGVEALASPKGNMSRYHDDPISITGENIIVVFESKDGKAIAEEEVKQFCNELIDQQVRYNTNIQFGHIRDLIVEEAFKPVSK